MTSSRLGIKRIRRVSRESPHMAVDVRLFEVPDALETEAALKQVGEW